MLNTLTASITVPLSSWTHDTSYTARTYIDMATTSPGSCYCYAVKGTSNMTFYFKMDYYATTNFTIFNIMPRVLKLRYSNADN